MKTEEERAAIEALSGVLVQLDRALAACIRAGFGSEITAALEDARKAADYAWSIAQD